MSGKNPLNEACKQHDIGQNEHRLVTRNQVNRRLADAAWPRFKAMEHHWTNVLRLGL